jgi:hypothetical protein
VEIGVQTWSVRQQFAADPLATLSHLRSFHFVELAGTGPIKPQKLAAALAESARPGANKPPPVHGAHLGTLGLEDGDVEQLVSEYADSFPQLRWVAFYLDPRDLDEFEDAGGRRSVMEKYGSRFKRIRQVILNTLYKKGMANRQIVPVYHTFSPDFLPLGQKPTSFGDRTAGVGDPTFAALPRWIPIQLDVFFAIQVGFKLAEFINDESAPTSKRGRRHFHSIHISGVTKSQQHTALFDSKDHYVDSNRRIASVAETQRIPVIIEHDNEMPVIDTALSSYTNLTTAFKKIGG